MDRPRWTPPANSKEKRKKLSALGTSHMIMAFKLFVLLTLLGVISSTGGLHSHPEQSHALRFVPKGETSTLESGRYEDIGQRSLKDVRKSAHGYPIQLNRKETEHLINEAERTSDPDDEELHVDVSEDSPSQDHVSNTGLFSLGSADGHEDGIDAIPFRTSLLGKAETVLDTLKHSEHYGRVRVMDYNGSERIYLPPHDFSRCGRCLCFNTSANQRIHADCKRIKGESFYLRSIPQDLPFDTSYLQMDGNSIKRFETYKLTMYKSLRRVDASRNHVSSLRQRDCHLPVSLNDLDLSHNNISHIEDGALSCMSNLTVLILNNNRIMNLTNRSFAGLFGLRVLNMAHNGLNHIQAGTFLDSQGLLELYLNNNKNLILSRRHVEVFRPLTALEVFHIQGCTSFSGGYPTEVLLMLPALKELSVNGEKKEFDSRLSALKNLTKLSIGTFSQYKRFCFTKNFTASYFNGLYNLESLTLQGCNAHTFSPNMFDSNPRIKEFRIVRELCDIKILFPLLCYLPRLDQIRSIQISDTIKHDKLDPLIVLTSDEVNCLGKMNNLQYLNLDSNGISKVEREFTINLPSSLKTLSVRSNFLIGVQSVLFQLVGIRSVLPNLTTLSEDMQGINDADSSETNNGPITFLKQGLASDSEFGLSHGGTDISVDLCSEQAQGRLLMTRENSETNAQPTETQDKHPKSVNIEKYSAYGAVKLGQPILSHAKRENISVPILNLSSTLITKWGTYPASLMPPATVIADLSENRCESFQTAFFRANNSLIEFHAQGNFLGPLLSKDTEGTRFTRLTNLEYLDLSRNHLYTLPWLLFQGMPRLRVLKLRLNDIDVVDIHIDHMTSLVFLDLARNSISSISKRTRDELDYLASKGHIYVDLTFNPLPCTCEGFELLKWMSETQVHILNKDILVCFDGNKQKEFVGNLLNRILALKRECVTKRLLIMACSFSFAILLLLTGFVLVFQKRWWIIYMRNRAISHFYGHRKSHKKPASPYTFDAFFVYAASGCDFVLDECLEELEENRGHRLCVEDRDFLAGSYVPCNITSAVRSSRTTVVVLDEHFRAEGWVQYAVEMAQVEAVRSKRDVLHLLFVGSPPDGCLPGAYLKVLRQGRFSEVPPRGCSPDVREKFWDTFSQILGHTQRQNDGSHPRLQIID